MVLKGYCSLPWLKWKCSLPWLWSVLRIWHSSRKFQTVLGCFKQFSEVWGSSRNSQTVLGSLKQFSEFLNSSRKTQTVLGRSKQFPEVLNSFRNFHTVGGLKKLLRFLKRYYEVCRKNRYSPAELLRGVGKIGTLQQNHRIKSLNEFYLLLKLQRTVGLLHI